MGPRGLSGLSWLVAVTSRPSHHECKRESDQSHLFPRPPAEGHRASETIAPITQEDPWFSVKIPKVDASVIPN